VRIARNVDAVHRHLAGGRQKDAAQHLQRGGLPGPVQAQKANDLALLDAEVQVQDGGVLSVILGQTLT